MLSQLIDCLPNAQDIKQNQLITLLSKMTRKQIVDANTQYQAATGSSLIQILRTTKEPHWFLFELLLKPQLDLAVTLLRDANLQVCSPLLFFVLALLDPQEVQTAYYEQAGSHLYQLVASLCRDPLYRRIVLSRLARRQELVSVPDVMEQLENAFQLGKTTQISSLSMASYGASKQSPAEEEIASQDPPQDPSQSHEQILDSKTPPPPAKTPSAKPSESEREDALFGLYGALLDEQLEQLAEELQRKHGITLQELNARALPKSPQRFIADLLASGKRVDRVCWLYNFFSVAGNVAGEEERALMLLYLFGLTYELDGLDETKARYEQRYGAPLTSALSGFSGTVWDVMSRFLGAQ